MVPGTDIARTQTVVAPRIGSPLAPLWRAERRAVAWFQAQRTERTDAVARAVKPLGDGHLAVPLFFIILGVGYLIGNAHLLQTGVLGIAGFLMTGALTQGLHIFAHRQRPCSGGDPGHWDGPVLASKNRSFPSGHTGIATVTCALLALRYPDPVVIPIACALLALTVGWSRLNDEAHWPSDVVVSWVIGSAVAFAVVGWWG